MQKDSKTVKKSSEKVLTGSWNCDIITELSARAAKASGTAMILENDTESRRTRTVIFTSHGKRKTVNSRMSFELGSEELLRFKNCQKKFRKGIDREPELRYNNRAVSASC